MSQQCTKCGLPFGEGCTWNSSCTRCANAKRLQDLIQCEIPAFEQGKDKENQEKLLRFLSRCAIQREGLCGMISQIAQMETRVRDTFWHMPKQLVYPVDQLENRDRLLFDDEESEHVVEIDRDGNPVLVIDSVDHSGNPDAFEEDMARSDEASEIPIHLTQTQVVEDSGDDESDKDEYEVPMSEATDQDLYGDAHLWEDPQPLFSRSTSILEPMNKRRREEEAQDPFDNYSLERRWSNAHESPENAANSSPDFRNLILGYKK